MNDIKRGDKLLCIKKFRCGNFIVGQYYEVCAFTMAQLGGSHKIPAVIMCCDGGFFDEWYFSHYDKSNYSYIGYYFSNKRMTRKEKLRRIKLHEL